MKAMIHISWLIYPSKSHIASNTIAQREMSKFEKKKNDLAISLFASMARVAAPHLRSQLQCIGVWGATRQMEVRVAFHAIRTILLLRIRNRTLHTWKTWNLKDFPLDELHWRF